jgi:hypothetical protein
MSTTLQYHVEHLENKIKWLKCMITLHIPESEMTEGPLKHFCYPKEGENWRDAHKRFLQLRENESVRTIQNSRQH